VEKASQSRPSGTSSRPVSAIVSRSAATRRGRFAQRESNGPCLRDASTLPLTPPPVPSCGSRTSGGATSVSATSSAAPTDRRLSRSTLSARAVRRRRHSHRILSSDSSVAPLSIEARAPGRALSALRPGLAVGEEVRSLVGFRARSMRSPSIHEICADRYKSDGRLALRSRATNGCPVVPREAAGSRRAGRPPPPGRDPPAPAGPETARCLGS
jgi:hypothetical protein